MSNLVKKICTRPLSEVAVLSDGRITTCCVDDKGLNTFASIYEDDFQSTFFTKFQRLKKKFHEDINHFPLCVKCFEARKNYYNDFHKTGLSTEEISAFLDEKTIPRGLVIEMTSHCNMKCGICISGLKNLKDYRQSGFMDADSLKKWLEPDINKIKAVRLYNYGETFLHPGAIDFCSFLTRENSSIHVNIATNIILLNTDEKIEKLVKAQPNVLFVSLHGANQKSVSKFMGPNAKYELALDIMRKITLKREELGLDFPVIVWKYLLLKFNDSHKEMSAAKSICKEYEIDFLGFDIATGPFASKRFCKGSKDFGNLKDSEYYIQNVGQRIARQKLKRKVINNTWDEEKCFNQ